MARTAAEILRRRGNPSEQGESTRKLLTSARSQARLPALERWMRYSKRAKAQNTTVMIVDIVDSEDNSESDDEEMDDFTSPLRSSRVPSSGDQRMAAMEMERSSNFPQQALESQQQTKQPVSDTLYTAHPGTKCCLALDCDNCAIHKTKYCLAHQSRDEQHTDSQGDITSAGSAIGAKDDTQQGDSEVPPPSLEDAGEGKTTENSAEVTSSIDPFGLNVVPYILSCYALTKNGTRCTNETRSQSHFCKVHKQKGSRSILDGINMAQKDKKFFGETNTTNCRAVTQRGLRCAFCAINKSNLCLLHLRFPPEKWCEDVPATDSRVMTKFASKPQSSPRQCKAKSLKFDRCKLLACQDSSYCRYHLDQEGKEDQGPEKKRRRMDTVVTGEEEPERTRMRCKAENRYGKQCSLISLPGEEYCYCHIDNTGGIGSPTSKDGVYQDMQCTGRNRENERCKLRALKGATCCQFHLGKSKGNEVDSDNDFEGGFEASVGSAGAQEGTQCVAMNRQNKQCRLSACPGTRYCRVHSHKTQDADSQSSLDVEQNRESDDMSTQEKRIKCTAVNSRFGQCHLWAVPGSRFCRSHEAKANTHGSDAEGEKGNASVPVGAARDPKRCVGTNKRGAQCGRRAVGQSLYCHAHSYFDEPLQEDCSEGGVASVVRKDESKGDSDQAGRLYCKAMARNGDKCGNAPMHGEVYCRHHIKLHHKVNNEEGGKKVSSAEESQRGQQDEADSVGQHIVETEQRNRCRGRNRKNVLCKHMASPGSIYCPNHLVESSMQSIGNNPTHQNKHETATYAEANDDNSGKEEHTPNDDTPAKAEHSQEEEAHEGKTLEGSQEGLIAEEEARDHGEDTLYNFHKKDQERCIYVSEHRRPCSFQAVNDTIYCHRHAHLLQDLLPVYEPTSIHGESDHLDEVSHLSSSSGGDEDDVSRPYKHKEFLKLWEACEEYCGEGTDDIESSRRVREANHVMAPEDTDGQMKAQYGRLLPRAMETMMKTILGLTREAVFLDIGHGIGNTCLQAAFTTGCEARGIEVVQGRNSIAEVFRDNMVNQNRDRAYPRVIGEVILRHGRLEEKSHQEFLTKGVTHAYVNNFNGVFADRSTKNNQKWFLDDYVAGLFALMAPGAVLVSLHPLSLGPTLEEANELRRKQGLEESGSASFYSVERLLLGKACDTVKWNQHSGNQTKIYVYKYTRLSQPTGSSSVFMCCNPGCKHAKAGETISATTLNDEGRCVINTCDCKFTAKSLRRQRKKSYKES